MVLSCAPDQGEGVLDLVQALWRIRDKEMGQERCAVEWENTLLLLNPDGAERENP